MGSPSHAFRYVKKQKAYPIAPLDDSVLLSPAESSEQLTGHDKDFIHGRRT